MAFSRRLGVVWFVGASWLVAVGCDDSEDRIPEPSGKGGEAPSAGKSSVAGSQNDGGKAGASPGAGAGGAVGGTGGSAAGGDAGQGGGGDMAGAAGLGGDATGGGGAAGGEGGAGGASAGAGGEGGAAVAASCSFSCANDADCVINQNNTTHKCNPVSHQCEDPTTACTVDVDCLPAFSFWTVQCLDDAGCAAGFQACVAVSGKGFCADLSDPTFPDEPCFGGAPRTLSRFGAVGTVEVCASPDARCFAGACALGCGDPTIGCGQGNGNTCSAATGRCECTQGTECTKTGVCGGDGQCQQCQVDGDCTATAVFDGRGVCVAGTCGCASPTTCVNPGYASATAACQ
jgi:hypothetical protein